MYGRKSIISRVNNFTILKGRFKGKKEKLRLNIGE